MIHVYGLFKPRWHLNWGLTPWKRKGLAEGNWWCASTDLSRWVGH